MTTTSCDVAIVGAGPYGLSAAAHLQKVKGLDVQVFGRPMSFWDSMPVGMLLRSNWTATQIANPDKDLTLEAYQAASGQRFALPVPLDQFIQYGLWYQRKAVPSLDPRMITCVVRDGNAFRVLPEDGEAVQAKRLVIAAGIEKFAARPQLFDCLPAALASHTSEHRDLAEFAGKRVLVVGGGQSALESAALLHESGAQTEVVSRSQDIVWLQGWLSKTLHHRMGLLIRRILYAPTDVGPAGLSQLAARPDLVRMLPRSVQDRFRKRAVRPAGARWLVDRLRGIPICLGCEVTSVKVVGGSVQVRLSDGSDRTADHILLGTGYRVNLNKYSFLSEQLRESIRVENGYPCLARGLETSVPGLHILGSPAARSFGPLMQFVSGTTYASRALLKSIARA